jgi:hypothetical protein
LIISNHKLKKLKSPLNPKSTESRSLILKKGQEHEETIEECSNNKSKVNNSQQGL